MIFIEYYLNNTHSDLKVCQLYAGLYWWRSIDIGQPGVEEKHVVPELTTGWRNQNKNEEENGEQEYEKLGKLFHSRPKHITFNNFSYILMNQNCRGYILDLHITF